MLVQKKFKKSLSVSQPSGKRGEPCTIAGDTVTIFFDLAAVLPAVRWADGLPPPFGESVDSKMQKHEGRQQEGGRGGGHKEGRRRKWITKRNRTLSHLITIEMCLLPQMHVS